MKRFPLLLAMVLYPLAAMSSHAADSRAGFLKLIKPGRGSFVPSVEEWPVTNSLAPFHFSFAADKAQRVPAVC